MSVIEPVNTQQVLQMSSAVEKVFTEQQVAHNADHVRKDEQDAINEAKRTEVQDAEETNETEKTDPDGQGRRRQLHIKKKPDSAEIEEEEVESKAVRPPEDGQGRHLDIRV